MELDAATSIQKRLEEVDELLVGIRNDLYRKDFTKEEKDRLRAAIRSVDEKVAIIVITRLF